MLLPLPVPVWTISRPFSLRLAAVEPVLRRLDPGHLGAGARPRRLGRVCDPPAVDPLGLLQRSRPMPGSSGRRSSSRSGRRRCCGAAARARAATASREALRRSRAEAAGLCSAMNAADLVVAEVGVEQRVEMVVARPRRRWRRRRTDSRPWPRSRTHPCSRGASRPRAISGWRRGRARRGRSPPSACARAGGRAGVWSLWKISGWRPGQVAHGGGQPALELVVVVAVEQVVLAIVLVVQDQLDAAPGAARSGPSASSALDPAAVGVAAPGQEGVARDRRSSLPGRARRSAPAARPRRRRACCRRPARWPAARRSASARSPAADQPRRARRVPPRASGLIASGSSSAATARHGVVEQLDLGREGVAEEAGDAQGDVDPRPVQHRERQHLDAGDPAGWSPSQTGRQPISASAWAMSSPPVRMLAVPQADSATCRGPVAVRLQIAARRPARPTASPAARPPASARRGCRPSRSCGRSAAPRAGRGSAPRSARAPRAGRRARAAGPRSPPRRRRRAAGRSRRSISCQHRRRRRPARARLPARRRPAARPAAPDARPCRRRSASGPGRAPAAAGPRARPRHRRASAPSGSQSEPEIGCQRPQQRGVAALAARRAAAAPGPPAGRSAGSPSGERPKTCRPSRICSSFSSHRWSSSRARCSSGGASRSRPRSRARPERVGCGRGCRSRRWSQAARVEARPPRDTRRPGASSSASSPQLSARVSGGVRWSTITAAGPPLGLRALAGIVDDERVEMRQRPEHGLGQAVGREGQWPCPAAIRGCRACRDARPHARRSAWRSQR